MEKKYRLRKDLPGVEAGTIFDRTKNADLPSHAKGLKAYTPESLICPQFPKNDVENNPEWFKEVRPVMKPEIYSRDDLLEYADSHWLSMTSALSKPKRKLPTCQETWAEWMRRQNPTLNLNNHE